MLQFYWIYKILVNIVLQILDGEIFERPLARSRGGYLGSYEERVTHCHHSATSNCVQKIKINSKPLTHIWFDAFVHQCSILKLNFLLLWQITACHAARRIKPKFSLNSDFYKFARNSYLYLHEMKPKTKQNAKWLTWWNKSLAKKYPFKRNEKS